MTNLKKTKYVRKLSTSTEWKQRGARIINVYESYHKNKPRIYKRQNNTEKGLTIPPLKKNITEVMIK